MLKRKEQTDNDIDALTCKRAAPITPFQMWEDGLSYGVFTIWVDLVQSLLFIKISSVNQVALQGQQEDHCSLPLYIGIMGSMGDLFSKELAD